MNSLRGRSGQSWWRWWCTHLRACAGFAIGAVGLDGRAPQFADNRHGIRGQEFAVPCHKTVRLRLLFRELAQVPKNQYATELHQARTRRLCSFALLKPKPAAIPPTRFAAVHPTRVRMREREHRSTGSTSARVGLRGCAAATLHAWNPVAHAMRCDAAPAGCCASAQPRRAGGSAAGAAVQS
jgi:hypothetical protein